MIYFIRLGRRGPIKIGYTGKPTSANRLSSLQVSNPWKLHVLLFIQGCKKQETALKARFAYACIRGEWFRPVPELLDCIDRHQNTKHPHPQSLLGRFLRRRGLVAEPFRTIPDLHRLAALSGLPYAGHLLAYTAPLPGGNFQ